jgi:ABC-type Fe3+-hydroxamate transport system substrate-binding protein
MSKAPVLQAFVARGLASREIARQSGRYVAAKDVLAELQSRLEAARVRHAKAPPDRQR